MLILDDTAEARALVPAGFRLRHPADHELGPEDLLAWERLGGARNAGGPLVAGEPGGFWKRAYVVDSAGDSQFDALNTLLDENAAPPAPAAAVALTGEGFHGHRGRPWTALRGNLHLSVLLTPTDLAAREALSIVMLPAVAAVDAISAATGGAIRPGIKWVNDLLIYGDKVAGVLAATKSEGDRLTAAILGIGVNVERTPQVRPTPFVPGVASLASRPECPGMRLADLVWPMLRAVEHRYRELLAEGPGPLLDAYRRSSVVVGRRVRIFPEGVDDESPVETWPSPIATGLVTAIEDDLSLRLAGREEPVNRGRLAFPNSGSIRPAEEAVDSNDHPTELG